MIDPRLADHEMGLELQIVELVEQHERALVQHRDADAATIQGEIDALQVELASNAETIAQTG
jgi:DNA-binding protein H-NS